jgi:hypothetical protein
MDTTAIRLARNLRSWATEVFENGPASFRKKASHIIAACDQYVREYDRNFEHIMSGGADRDTTATEAHRMMRQALFLTYAGLEGMECNLLPRVLRLCVEANVKAPEGWHGRLLIPEGLEDKNSERAKVYRKRFVNPGTKERKP